MKGLYFLFVFIGFGNIFGQGITEDELYWKLLVHSNEFIEIFEKNELYLCDSSIILETPEAINYFDYSFLSERPRLNYSDKKETCTAITFYKSKKHVFHARTNYFTVYSEKCLIKYSYKFSYTVKIKKGKVLIKILNINKLHSTARLL